MAIVRVTYPAAVSVDADDADPTVANLTLLRSRAHNALVANTTFLGIASPTNAQAVAQVQALTRQVNALLRLALGQFDSSADT